MATNVAQPDQVAPAMAAQRRLVASALTNLSVRKIGALYVLVLICVIFSFWAPATFPTVATVKQVLDSNSVTMLAALALVVPLAARTFDLSFAYTMSLSGCTSAYFVVSHNMSVLEASVLGMLAALLIGVVNGFVVVVMRIDSFIGTLATGSLVEAFITFFTNDTSINSAKLAGGFSDLGQYSFAGITWQVVYALVLAAGLWIFMEYTATGRRLYAAGFNPEAARLANIRVNKLRFCSLLVSATIAGFAGLVLASELSSGSPSAGTDYLLPAFAAVFLGATQFKSGRFNAWGTVLAVLMLGTGVVGLGLANAPSWAADMFTGVVLIAALAVTGLQRRRVRSASGSSLGRIFRLRLRVS